MGGLKFGTDGDGNYGYYGADGSLIPFKKIVLADEINYTNYNYTINGLYPNVYNAELDTGCNIISGGYCVDGDLVHVDIVWQQQGSYGAESVRIKGFPKPSKEIKIDSSYQIDTISSYNNYKGTLRTDGSLGMSVGNVYAKKVHWQFTYRKAE